MLLVLCALPALANDGPTPRFFAEANGSAVELNKEQQAADETAVRRESAGADCETEHDRNWAIDSTWWGDYTGETWTCDEFPDRCEDCNGDGVDPAVDDSLFGCATAPARQAGRLLLGLGMGRVGWLAICRD